MTRAAASPARRREERPTIDTRDLANAPQSALCMPRSGVELVVDNPKKIYAAACQMLYEMEVELGLARLPYHQKRVIQVASGVASDRGQFETAKVLDLCGQRHDMSRATFFRALAALKRSGWATEVRPGTYTLNLSPR